MFFNNGITFTDWTTNFATDGGSNYPFQGWALQTNNTRVSYPSLFVKGIVVESTITQKVEPASITYTFTGDLFRTFYKPNIVSTGTWETYDIVATTALESKIYYFPKALPTYSPYHATSNSLGESFTITENEDVYVVWATPFGSTKTRKRIDYCVKKASGATTIDGAAVKIQDALTAGEPPYFSINSSNIPLKEGAHWKLLDGTVSGECDEGAELMKRCMNMLGIEASAGKVYASTNTDVLDLEWRSPQADYGGDKEYLVLMFGGTAPNAFEGYCKVNSIIYTIFPKMSAVSELELLRTMVETNGVVQQWVQMEEGWYPGRTVGGNWISHITHIYSDPVPAP